VIECGANCNKVLKKFARVSSKFICNHESRPLPKVASGGELSQAMLAMKTVLAAHDRVDTLVFDEIECQGRWPG
jgi:DNA repair ATPase RecN